MNFSTWTTPGTGTGRAPQQTRALRVLGLALLATALTGCPVDDPAGNPDGGPPRGDMDIACTAEYAPVCGVDGQTYGNACEASARGVLISHYGPCEDPGVRCGGVYGDTCSPYEYCDYSGGGAADLIALPFDGGAPPPGPSGICRPIDQRYCDDDSDCSVDQYCQAYGSDADIPSGAPDEAPPFIPAPFDAGAPIGADAGAPIVVDAGVMPPPRGTCQPREVRYCYSEDDPICREGEYCDLSGDGIDLVPQPEPDPDADPARPLIAPPPGVCRPDTDPPGCPNEDAFVCGTNGITYQNACVAESMNATIAYEGRCVPGGPRSCGGLLGGTCADTEYCHFEPATQCDYADASGVCTPRPDDCTRELNPVCGCNGQTYSNPCVAASSGTSVASYGACDTDPVPGEEGSACGGRAGAMCLDGLFCDYPEDALCGAADGPGVCTAIPQFCPDIWQPVCGCDGSIYGNSCEAASASVSVGPRSNCLAP